MHRGLAILFRTFPGSKQIRRRRHLCIVRLPTRDSVPPRGPDRKGVVTPKCSAWTDHGLGNFHAENVSEMRKSLLFNSIRRLRSENPATTNDEVPRHSMQPRNNYRHGRDDSGIPAPAVILSHTPPSGTADQPARSCRGRTLAVVQVIILQHVADVGRMIDEENGAGYASNAYQIAACSRLEEEGKRLLT